MPKGNQVKDKLADMVSDAIKGQIGNVVLSWPEHAIPFYGRVSAGSGMLEVIHLKELPYTTVIRLPTPAGSRRFEVTIKETF